MQNILLVSHCLLNISAKVVLYEQDEIDAEEALRRKFLQKAIEKGVQFLQLPCPEFTLYGACRWGHVSTQFDNPFFRQHCQDILKPIFLQLNEYLAHPERFHVMGVLGIDGSPSCGVDYTCIGSWGGSFGGRKDLDETLQDVALVKTKGVLMDELLKGLKERDLENKVPIIGLFAKEEEKCMSLLENLRE